MSQGRFLLGHFDQTETFGKKKSHEITEIKLHSVFNSGRDGMQKNAGPAFPPGNPNRKEAAGIRKSKQKEFQLLHARTPTSSPK